MVAVAVLVLRKKEPDRHRPFSTPVIWVVAPLSILGCIGLFFFLPTKAKLLFPIWSAIGLACYFSYGVRHSHLCKEK
jgi:APA family basic amino acid/polyamine antiporter